MITIINQKVAGFEPRWADFRGYSLLFDNPGDSLTPSGALLDLNSQVDTDPELGFYQALNNSIAAIGRDMLIRFYLFCPLPPPSYHVTVWDGGNDANVADVAPTYRFVLEDQLRGLPLSLPQKNALTDVVLASPLASLNSEIVFRFDRLIKWGNSVLVAHLLPAEGFEAQFQQIVEYRSELSAAFGVLTGLPTSKRYTPHVSLGYFANQEAAQSATPCIDGWSTVIREHLSELHLSFRTVGLYGFTNMAHFFKVNT